MPLIKERCRTATRTRCDGWIRRMPWAAAAHYERHHQLIHHEQVGLQEQTGCLQAGSIWF